MKYKQNKHLNHLNRKKRYTLKISNKKNCSFDTFKIKIMRILNLINPSNKFSNKKKINNLQKRLSF